MVRDDMHDLVVIGAGSAGLTAVKFGLKLGATVALVEKSRVGGDCTWTGCVPSKALLHVAKTMQAAQQASRFGKTADPIRTDMSKVKTYVQDRIQTVYASETPEKLAAEGADVFFGKARFLDENRVQVGEQIICGKKFVLATGARPFIPPIDGLLETPYMTYKHIFENDRLPERLLVLGAGPIGMELGQAYRRLGAQVTLVDVALLPREEPEVAAVMAQVFASEGIQCVRGLAAAVTYNNNQFSLLVEDKEARQSRQLTGDMLLVAVGRIPNVSGMDLEKVGVAYGREGIQVNQNLATTASHIFAAGDCTGGLQFTHYAGWQGFQAVRNGLLPGSSKGVSDVIPNVTFTEPEVAHVGLTEQAAIEAYGEKAQVWQRPLNQDDRAVVDGATEGFIKIVGLADGRVLGATVVAPRAGEMIAEVTLAIQNKLKLRDIAYTIHPYPTYTNSLQLLAADWATEDFLDSVAGRFLGWLNRP
ncbi:MAG: FAD-dependent oxidoreductase [Chloroflexi bacterium]|nr:FAD-dependent oxidoreductase [Chloroflexota bacterium]